jgi:hypothetical protein
MFSMVSAELLRRKMPEGVALSVLTAALGLGLVGLMLKEVGLTLSNLKTLLAKLAGRFV